MEFGKRLDECRLLAALSISDLALWFGVPRTSIHNWLKGSEPQPYRLPWLDRRLALLVKAITRHKSPFPVPPGLGQYARANYIRDILHATGADLPRNDPA